MDDIFTQEMIVPSIIVFIVAVVLTSIVFFLINKAREKKGLSKLKDAENEAAKIIDDAKKTAEAEKKEKIILAKEEIQKERAELDKEIKERRAETQKQERRLQQNRGGNHILKSWSKTFIK